MKNEFTYDELKKKYSKRVGNYKSRDVIVRSKYDDLGDNVYILYDYNNALIVDGYWIATIREDGSLSHRKATPWVKIASPADRPLTCPEGDSDGETDINLDVDMTLVDSLLELAYNDILSDLMYKE